MSTQQQHTTQQQRRTTDEVKQRAREIIRTLEHDHRFCANCYQRIREVEEPPGTHYWSSEQSITRRAVVGFCYPTENTIEGIGVDKSRGESDEMTRDGWAFTTRRICECGAAHHQTKQRPLRRHTAIAAARHLSASIDDLRDEYETASGKLYERVDDWRHSERRLVEAIKTLKGNPDNQGANKPIFEAALATALLHPDDARESADSRSS